MPYPARYLHEDEEVYLDVRPHWIRLVGPVFAGTVLTGGALAGFVAWSGAPRWFVDALVIVVVLGWFVIGSRILRWRATNLVITSQRVIYRRGVLRRVGRQIPIARVQDVSYDQSFGERIVGAGVLVIESAGEAGRSEFPDVARPEAVQGIVIQAMRGATERGPREEKDPVQARLATLEDLHRRGILTDGEWEQKRSELLSSL